ncbi:hypothetical protein [Flavobacterium sp.]|jgi:hypothetical protein|uniref:hypothetical protein n=1 Tax=Flavobacterium sp. TaxID=239 RepID=UPI002A831593|nr:hypothetical protein [Flavobacterium sp.]
MKLYYYLLYRIYWFYRDVWGYGHKMSLVLTGFLSSLFVYLTIEVFIVLFYTSDKSPLPSLPNKYYVVLELLILFLFNHKLIIKKREFLRQGFKKTTKGLMFILLYVLFLTVILIWGANINRDKIKSSMLSNSRGSLVSENEMKNNVFALKNLASGEQQKVDYETLITLLK